MDRRCALCRAIVDNAGPQNKPRIENSILLESQRFVVIPAMGPMAPGHVLVVSREHHPSLAAMGEQAIQEYAGIAKHLAAMPLFRTQRPLEAEHGSTGSHKAGACVMHTHIHWLPGMGRYESAFDGWMDKLSEGENLCELQAFATTPYIFTRGDSARWRCYHAIGQDSQMIRRTLCDELGRTDLNWRNSLRPDWVSQTVELLGKSSEGRHPSIQMRCLPGLQGSATERAQEM